MKRVEFFYVFLTALLFGGLQAQDKPNVLLITIDDIAQCALSCYSHGMMYPTPNIDRIAENGILFTDYYCQPSCTAGRAEMILGQLPVRTGLTTVGQPGNPIGVQKEDPTLAEFLKPLGYKTAQFGKNHLGDRNEHLPTNHGFDEFYGNLYHLNASEEPLQHDYPKSQAFRDKYAPRGVIESYATDTDDPTVDGKFGRVGKQRIIKHGLFTEELLQNFDRILVDKSTKFMKESKDEDKPFFIWYAASKNHVYIHQTEENRYLAADISEDMDKHGSGIMEVDKHVGKMLDYLESIGELDNTIVLFNTDNGPEVETWPDAGVTKFRGGKMTTYEGGMRSPFVVSWPGKIPAGRKLNGISAGLDIIPTLYAAITGEDDLVEQIAKGKKIGNTTYKVHLDGYNAWDYWTGKTSESPRHELFYYYESRLTAVRFDQWKVHFATKEHYSSDLIERSVIHVYNLRKDPFEVYDGIIGFHQAMRKSWIMQPIIGVVKDHFLTFKDYPIRQGSASLNVNEVIDKMERLEVQH